MALEKDRIEEALKKLPSELHDEVLNFVESLLERNGARDAHVAGNGTASVRSLFGTWDSGDPRSADNEKTLSSPANMAILTKQYLQPERFQFFQKALFCELASKEY